MSLRYFGWLTGKLYLATTGFEGTLAFLENVGECGEFLTDDDTLQQCFEEEQKTKATICKDFCPKYQACLEKMKERG